MNRRHFIRIVPLTGGGLVLGLSGLAKAFAPADETTVADTAAAMGDFLSVQTNGDVIFHFTKHEMGQGVSTAMAMLIAEELCADFERVKVSFPPADLVKYNDANGGHGTGGSSTVITMTPILRKAGATAREMLVQAAAAQWNTTPDNCYAESHFIINKISGQRTGFGELAQQAAKLKVPASVTLKSRNNFNIIGRWQS
jgi:CO/xanthine dehydrogenase Mo-binding subunit